MTVPRKGVRLRYNSRISGTGSYLPERILSNQDLEKLVDTNDEWIRERTGITHRHLAAAEQATSDLALIASQRAMQAAGISAEQIDAILVATVTPDQPMPSTACLLQAKLGCRPIMAVDLSAACSGFIYAVSIADQYIRGGMFRNVLVVGAEVLSRIMDYRDRQTCILFGDGAGAVVLSRSEDTSEKASRIITSHLASDGNLADLLFLPGGGSRHPATNATVASNLHFVHMKGREIFKAAVRTLVNQCQDALEAGQMKSSDVDWFLIHQANLRIIEAVVQSLKVPMERVPTNVHRVGNTSSASIPLLLDETVRKNRIQRGETLLLAAFGAGLTSGSVLLRY